MAAVFFYDDDALSNSHGVKLESIVPLIGGDRIADPEEIGRGVSDAYASDRRRGRRLLDHCAARPGASDGGDFREGRGLNLRRCLGGARLVLFVYQIQEKSSLPGSRVLFVPRFEDARAVCCRIIVLTSSTSR